MGLMPILKRLIKPSEKYLYNDCCKPKTKLYFILKSNQSVNGGMIPSNLSRPSENKARTTHPTEKLIIEALRLCRRIASSIIS